MPILFKKIRNLIPLFVLVLLVLAGYLPIIFGFFQQDEWLGLARFIPFKDGSFSEVFLNAIAPSGTHYTPLATIVIYLMFSIFGLNYPLYAIVSIILHILASLLIFSLAKAIFGNSKLAFCAMILFGVSSAGFQATSWPIADISTHFSTIFGFLSLILFFKFMQKIKKHLLIFSLITLLISLLFKENTIGFFILFPAMLFIFSSINKSSKIKYSLIIILVGLIYLSLRLMMLHSLSQTFSQGNSNQPTFKFLYNVVYIAPRAFSQSLVPSFQMYEITHGVTKFLPASLTGEFGSPKYDKFVLESIFEIANILLFLGLVAFCLFLFKHSNSKASKIIVFSVLFVLINSLPLMFAPERAGIIFTIDSRNLYLISTGTIILIITIGSLIRNKTNLIVLFLIYITLNLLWLSQQTSKLMKEGQERREILNKIKSEYPNFPPKSIIYTESDSSFYGLPPNEKILPFQSGFGQMLLVWYDSSMDFPKDFFKNKFLWEITDQGYKESKENKEVGFGYFRDFSLLTKAVEGNNIPLESIIAFSYDSQNKDLRNMSTELRGRLNGFSIKKSKVSQRKFQIKSVYNHEGLHLALDQNRKTFWDSKVPYKLPIILEVELDNLAKIAQLEIDSYTNKNQNEVGYEISLSLDGDNWKKVFYAKRFTPNIDGLTNIYFEPQEARFIRIEQKGYHDNAPWVIHELNVYTAI